MIDNFIRYNIPGNHGYETPKHPDNYRDRDYSSRLAGLMRRIHLVVRLTNFSSLTPEI
jgi:hypothetical protein